FVSEASVYRLLKAHDLIASPAFIVIKAADAFKDKTTAPNQLWQTDFTYLKVIGWGWFYLSTVLDDFSRYLVAWKLCTTMKAEDVTATLELALQASGLHQAKPRTGAAGLRFAPSQASNWRCRPQVCTEPSPRSGRGSCQTTGPATSRAISPSGSTTARSSTCAARPIIQ